MRYGIIADVHSNLEALGAVLRALKGKEEVDSILCAGDLVGYGADPSACLELIRQEAQQVVGGNHDRAVAGQMELDWFNPVAREAVVWTQGRVSESDRGYLKGLALVWQDAEVTLVHGSLLEPEKFHYVLDGATANASLALQKTPVAFIGHTHVPGVFVRQRGPEGEERIFFQRPSEIRLEASLKYLVNAGSVGQPRDGDPRAAYCVYDTESKNLAFRRVPYPVTVAQKKIREAGLPEFLAQRLAVGY